MIMVQLLPKLRLLDKSHKILYDDLCLVASNKQQINWEEVKESTGKLENGQLLRVFV